MSCSGQPLATQLFGSVPNEGIMKNEAQLAKRRLRLILTSRARGGWRPVIRIMRSMRNGSADDFEFQKKFDHKVTTKAGKGHCTGREGSDY
jgi:hypothetical protein